MKRPSFQFYPGDWKLNKKLRLCSIAARGAWVEVLCFLHDSDEYGVARVTLDELARAVSVDLRLLKQLSEKSVLKGADANCPAYVYRPHHAGRKGDPVVLLAASANPCWYCSRFVRDEWVRQQRGKTTRFSADNQPPKEQRQGERQGESPTRIPTGPVGERLGDGPSSPSSSSTTVSNTSRTRGSATGNGSQPREETSRSTPAHASHSVTKTEQQISENRAAATRAAPMPDELRKYLPKREEPTRFNEHRSPFDEEPNP